MRTALDSLHLDPAHEKPLWDYLTLAADSLRNTRA
jgi:truncated hemoglobin YjbI